MNKQILIAVSLTALVTLAFGIGGGYWYAIKKTAKQAQSKSEKESAPKILYYRNPMNPAITSPTAAKDEMGMDYIPVYADDSALSKPAEPEILYYRNPMNPAITSPAPAKDEMGMDYIPVYADGGPGKDEPAGTVEIDPVTVQNIGVRTSIAQKQILSRTIRSVGRVDYNEERMARIHPKVEGWIEELYIKKTGERVEEDTILLSIYSPQLVASQQEYLLALKNLEILQNSPFEDIRQGAVDLVATSRKRLEFLDVPTHQIEELTRDKTVKKSLHIHSPFEGIIMNLGILEGDYVSPKTELYMLADLERVWVYVDVYEYELPWVTLGDPAEMTVAAVPGKVYQGEVTYIYPYMEKKTRTARVRLEFDNTDRKLKPDMFANVTLKADRKVEAVVVPSEAIVRSGSRDQVFVQRDKGKFEPREVNVGVSAEGLTQIVRGLEAGEKVVTSSQFLIDSESKLREATAKMLEAMGAAGTAADQSVMDDMSMDDLSMDTLKNVDLDDMDMEDLTMETLGHKNMGKAAEEK